MRLLTGGSGLLGRHLRKLMKVDAPSHKRLDITNPRGRKKYNLIIHAAAYTKVAQAEIDRDECFRVNVFGTHQLLHKYDIPFVYISSEYAKNPVNYYSFTKYLAEQFVKMHSNRYLIIRTLFKPNPFPWPMAYGDQYTRGDYVDVIAPLIAKAIRKWDKKTSKLIYVGTGRKTIYDLAKRTNPNVRKGSIKEMKSVKLPSDYR